MQAAARRILVLGVALVALRFALAWAWPLVLAVVLAAVLERPVARLAKATGLGRPLAAGVVLGVGVSCGLALATYLVAHLVPEIVSLHTLTPTLARDIVRVGEAAVRSLGPPGAWPEPLRSALRSETASAGRLLSRIAVQTLTAFALLPRLAAGLGFAVVAAYLMVVDGPLTARMAGPLADVPAVEQGLHTLAVGARAAWRLASAELMLAGLSALFSALAFWLLGARVPLVLGAIAGLLDLIPYAGPAVLLLPWAGYLAISGDGERCALVLAAWLALALVRGILELRWIGRGVGLSTLGVLVSFYVGARVLGVVGILLGPVCAAAVWAVWREGRAEASTVRPVARPVPRPWRPRASRVHVLAWGRNRRT